MAESVVNTRRRVAGTIKIPFTSERAWITWDQFLHSRLNTYDARAALLCQELVEDIDLDFIRLANAAAAGQPGRNDDILPPLTREMFVEGIERLRNNPPGPAEPALLVNRQLIEEIRQWGITTVADAIEAGENVGRTELFNVSMVTTPSISSAHFNRSLSEAFAEGEEILQLTTAESMQTTVRLWFDELCRGQMPWIAEAAAVTAAIEAVRAYTQSNTREDGFYRQILPPIPIPLSELNAELDRQAVERGGVPDPPRAASYREICQSFGIQPLPPEVIFIIETVVFAAVVKRLVMSLTVRIGWPTPATGLRALSWVVQDATDGPNTLSSGQENSGNGQSSQHSFRDRSDSDRAAES